MIPVFVISLERSSDRRMGMKAHLDELGIPFSFLDAVDGANGLEAYSPTYRRNLMPGEIGCFLSHAKAAQTIVDRGHEFACVLEDDARLLPSTLSMLNEHALAALPSFDALRLTASWHGRRKIVSTNGDLAICAPLYRLAGSHAQIYSQSGAQKIANARPSDPLTVLFSRMEAVPWNIFLWPWTYGSVARDLWRPHPFERTRRTVVPQVAATGA